MIEIVTLALVVLILGIGWLAAYIFRRGPVFAFGVSSGIVLALFTALYLLVDPPNWADDVIAAIVL